MTTWKISINYPNAGIEFERKRELIEGRGARLREKFKRFMDDDRFFFQVCLYI